MSDEQTKRVLRSFESQLIEDVISARERLAAVDTQASRRDVVRATFAAIEGIVWLCRRQVLEISASMTEVDALTILALREQTYSVTERGLINKQTRSVPLQAMIKLVVRQARKLNQSLNIDFNEPGWDDLLLAIKIRNRATHPKSLDDLQISDDDLISVNSGFHWLLAQAENILGAAVQAFRLFNADARDLLEALKAGDPAALAAYRYEIAAAFDL